MSSLRLRSNQMKITEKKLRKAIRESVLAERGTNNPRLVDAERKLTTAIVEWIEQYRLVMGMDPNDFGDDRRIRRTLDDIVGGLIE